MELLHSEMVHGKCAKLYKDAHNDIIVTYDGLEIDHSGNETYLNLSARDAQSIYVRLCVADYERARMKEADFEDLKDFAKGLGWEV